MLTLEELILETDGDMPIVASVITGFDDNGCLVIKYECVDYEHHSKTQSRCAVIEKQDAYTLAKKLKVSLTELPAYISSEYSIPASCQAVPSKAFDLFKEILDFIISYRINYKII